MTTPSADLAARQGWMGLLARAAPARLAALMPADLPAATLLRAPEIGAVMVRGRVGATGAPFNLGEMTVTRCALRLDCGTVGHGHVQGRNRDHARHAALIDGGTEATMSLERAELLVESLNLEDVDPAAIDPEAALFNDGLGLDSIDAIRSRSTPMKTEGRKGVFST